VPASATNAECGDLTLRALHATGNKIPSGASGAVSTSRNTSLSSEFLAGFNSGFGSLPGSVRDGAKVKTNRSRDKYHHNRFHQNLQN
jgi:hypothetical protein